MRLFSRSKDGGPESTVTGYWLCEFKRLFSIVLLRFDNGSRDAYHEHAFNSVSWVLRGRLVERVLRMREVCSVYVTATYRPSWRPVVTRRETLHKVTSIGRTWVLSFRGPWARTWREYIPSADVVITLTDGRREVA